MLGRVVGRLVVAPVAGEDFGAAGEAEPAVAFRVVLASPASGQLGAGGDAEVFFGLVVV